MDEKTVGEILSELVLDDVMADGTLLEFNPNHDNRGRFTGKTAELLYATGAMARARAEGIRMKGAGGSRDQVRAAIVKSLQTSKRAPIPNPNDLGLHRGQAVSVKLAGARKEAAYHQQQIAAGKGAAPERMLRRYQNQAWMQM